MKIIIVLILFIFIFFKVKEMMHPTNILSIYFGVPGAGKSTIAAHLVRKDLKKNKKVWSNVPITGAIQLEPKDDIGKYMIHDGHVIIDEAGIEYNNRDFKKFTNESLYFYKYHRHYQLDIDFFSQGHEDCDKKIRDLAQRLYVVKKSFIPYFVYRKRIGKRVGINKLSGEIQDEYYFTPFGTTYYFSPIVWKSFNTLSRKEFPDKLWETW